MTERDIIKGCKRKKAKCQKELVQRYSPMLMTVARRYCKDDPAAEDVLQETFMRVFNAIGQYQHQGTFSAWLRQILVNVALQKREKAAYQREHAGLSEVQHPTAEPAVFSRLEAETAIRLIQQLPEGFRLVFNLYVFEGYTHQEIGEILRVSAATSRSQLTRARQKLKAMIVNLEKEHYVKRVG